MLEEKISFYRPQRLPEIEVLAVENGRKLWRVFHENYAVCIIPRLTWGEWVYRGELVSGTQGQLMLVEPGNVHDTKKMKEGASFQVLFFPPKLIEDLSKEAGLSSNPHMRLPLLNDRSLYKCFSELYAATLGKPRLEQKSRLVNCVGQLLCQYTETSPRSTSQSVDFSKLAQARDYIVENVSEDIELDELSSISGLSRFHFLRSFSRFYGAPPHAYQMHVRVAKAKDLLSKGMHPSELGLGFSDQSHFIRHFKRAWGVTPGNYTKMIHRPFSGWGFDNSGQSPLFLPGM